MPKELEIEFLIPVKGTVLDEYLARGWYRMGAYIFTTHILRPHSNDEAYPVFWLRYDVSKVVLSRSARNIVKACRGFSVRFRPFSMTDELADLYSRYHAGIDFQASETLENVLFDLNRVVYDTYLIEVRDNGRLIAVGIFDKGKESIAGIVNFYDHDYKQYSLGKLMILLKYQYCLFYKISWYYPGYYSPEYPKFDYKLFLDKEATEVYLPGSDAWLAYTEFTKLR